MGLEYGAVSDPVRDALVLPLRLGWDGVQLHAAADITVHELDGVLRRLETLRNMLSNQLKPGLILPSQLPVFETRSQRSADDDQESDRDHRTSSIEPMHGDDRDA